MNQIISNLSVWFISAVYGLESGWSGPGLKFLSSSESPFLITPMDITWLSITSTAGNIISICSCTIAAQYYGRKPLFSTCCVVLGVGWTLNCFANTLALLMMSKFLINLALGIFDVLNCIYISEVCSAKNRGVLVSISMVFYTIGAECEYIIGFFQNYILLSVVPLCVSILAIISSWFLVESPYFLIMNGKNEEAYKNLSVLDDTGSEINITRSYKELIQYVEGEKSSGLNFFHYISLPHNYRIFFAY